MTNHAFDAINGLVHHWRWDYLGLERKIEFVPIRWARAYMLRRHGTITVTTNNEIVNVQQLGQRLQTEGVRYAGVIEISRETRHARMVSGNHRLLAIEAMGGMHFPCCVMVIDRFHRLPHEPGIDQSSNLSGLATQTVGDVIEQPSRIFFDLEKMQAAGELPEAPTVEVPPVE